MRDDSLDPFRDEIVGFGVILAITLAAAPPFHHSCQTPHATVNYIRAAIVDDFFAGAFVGTGKDRAEHYTIGTGDNRFRYITGVTHTAIGDNRDRALKGG